MLKENVMNLPVRLSLMVTLILVPTIACAELSYNADHSEAMKNLHAIENATVNLQYQCGEYSLIFSGYATESDVNGRRASITGKIVSKSATHDISENLTKAVSRHNLLTNKMSVSCNADKGAFQVIFTPNEFDEQPYGRTTVKVFADGTVTGSRAHNISNK